MDAGRELDALIAEKVMGCRITMDSQYGPACGCKEMPHADCDSGTYLFHYSTDIAAAWAVVEQFRRGKCPGRVACAVDLHITDVPEDDGDCFVEIASPALAPVSAQAPEMPLAICLAALKAVNAI